MVVSEGSSAKIRSKGWSWTPSAAAAVAAMAVMLTAAPARPVDLQAAAGNYSDSCVDCHGQSGKGDGPKAAQLKTKAANYTDCAAMAKFNDDYLFKIIKLGSEKLGKGKDMADFGKAYDDDEIRALVAYVRGFCKK